MAKIIIEDIDYSTGRQVAGPRNKNSYNTKAKTCKAARMNCVWAGMCGLVSTVYAELMRESVNRCAGGKGRSGDWDWGDRGKTEQLDVGVR